MSSLACLQCPEVHPNCTPKFAELVFMTLILDWASESTVQWSNIPEMKYKKMTLLYTACIVCGPAILSQYVVLIKQCSIIQVL